MVKNNNINEIANLRSDDPSVRRNTIEGLMFADLDDAAIFEISRFIADTDRGVRGTVTLILMNSTNENIPNYITPFISSKEIAVRNSAGEILLHHGRNSVDAMMNYLPERNDDDKKFIIDILGLIGDKKAGKIILNELKVSDNANNVLACIEALGNLCYEDSLDEIISNYSKNELYQPTVIEALGKIGSTKALEFMFSLYNDEDELTKFSIIESFGLIGDENTFFFLLSQLFLNHGPIVWAIIESIYLLKTKFGFDIPYDERMKNLLLRAILETDGKYKKAAVYLASEFEDKEMILTFLKIVGEDAELDEELKSKFFEHYRLVLSNIGEVIKSSPDNLLSLLTLLLELLQQIPGTYTQDISLLEARNTSDAVAACIDYPDEEVRRIAFELLCRLDSETAVLFADKMADDSNEWNRLKLLELLENLDREETTSAIEKLADDPEEIVRERAMNILNTTSKNKIINL